VTLMGDNAPLRVDPIALAAEAGPQMNSTERIRAALQNFGAGQTGVAQRRKRLWRLARRSRPGGNGAARA
jgi:hypothetical protein